MTQVMSTETTEYKFAIAAGLADALRESDTGAWINDYQDKQPEKIKVHAEMLEQELVNNDIITEADIEAEVARYRGQGVSDAELREVAHKFAGTSRGALAEMRKAVEDASQGAREEKAEANDIEDLDKKIETLEEDIKQLTKERDEHELAATAAESRADTTMRGQLNQQELEAYEKLDEEEKKAYRQKWAADNMDSNDPKKREAALSIGKDEQIADDEWKKFALTNEQLTKTQEKLHIATSERDKFIEEKTAGLKDNESISSIQKSDEQLRKEALIKSEEEIIAPTNGSKHVPDNGLSF